MEKTSSWNIWIKLSILMLGFNLIKQMAIFWWSWNHIIPWNATQDQAKTIEATNQQGPPYLLLLFVVAAGAYFLMSIWERKPILSDNKHKWLHQLLRIVVILVGLYVVTLITSIALLPITMIIAYQPILWVIAAIIGLALVAIVIRASWIRKQHLIHQLPAEQIFI